MTSELRSFLKEFFYEGCEVKDAIAFLEDGEALEKEGIDDQEYVEALYAELKSLQCEVCQSNGMQYKAEYITFEDYYLCRDCCIQRLVDAVMQDINSYPHKNSIELSIDGHLDNVIEFKDLSLTSDEYNNVVKDIEQKMFEWYDRTIIIDIVNDINNIKAIEDCYKKYSKKDLLITLDLYQKNIFDIDYNIKQSFDYILSETQLDSYKDYVRSCDKMLTIRILRELIADKE